MAHQFLVRYGLMAQVGQFSADSAEFERGARVVVRSHRGTELGEILTRLPAVSDAEAGAAHVLRAAGPDDLERARRAELDRTDQFERCQGLFQDGVWPLELVDVEPLLDERRTVLHYLGPHRLDVTGLLSVFRSKLNLEVMLEPVGRDVADEPEAESEAEVAEAAGGCGSCSTAGGCGGCGSRAGASGGCSSCGVKTLLAGRSRASAAR